MYAVPFRIPGGKPVTELPGSKPRLPFTTVGPVFVIVAMARISKSEAAPRFIGIRSVAVVPVVKVHDVLASALPGRSLAPFEIVAVKVVLDARGLFGVNVAMLSGTS